MEAGDKCTINTIGDLYSVFEARKFIGQPCIIIKETKAGLIQVHLRDDPGKQYSFPARNITIIKD